MNNKAIVLPFLFCYNLLKVGNKMDNLIDTIKNYLILEKSYIAFLSDEVEYIIEDRVTNYNEIELLLDRIMSLMSPEKEVLFNRLCNYYENINKEYALEYRKIYKEFD